jgi:butyryl-CoA dehydrogenase
MGKLGLMGMPYPKEYGGAGLDVLSYAIAVEELSRVDGGTGVILSAHTVPGHVAHRAFGNEEQKQKYLVPLCTGENLGAFGLTEPNAGSDAGGTETTAVDKGDHYLLNGGKIFITNGGEADTYVVFAVTTPDIGTRGISAFIVEKGWKGFDLRRPLRQAGHPLLRHLRADLQRCEGPEGKPAGQGGPGLQDRHGHAGRRPHRHRGAGAGHRPGRL